MKRFIVAFVVSLCFFESMCFATSVAVKYIVDGDTFAGDVILDDGTKVKSVNVRLRNVDTPEIHGECDSEIAMANRAKQRLSELIPVGSMLEIKISKMINMMGELMRMFLIRMGMMLD